MLGGRRHQFHDLVLVADVAVHEQPRAALCLDQRDGLPPALVARIRHHRGYFYLNLTHMRLFGIRMGMTPDMLDAAFLGSHPDTPPHRDDPRDPCPDCTERLRASMAWAMSATAFPEIDADRDRALAHRENRPDLTTLSDADLVERMRSFLSELGNAFYRHDFSSLSSTVSPAVIGRLLAKIGRPELLLDLISGLGEVDSAAPSVALWDLSREIVGSAGLTGLLDQGHTSFLAAIRDGRQPEFARAFGTFLREYGCRGPNEWDIRSRSWEAHRVIRDLDDEGKLDPGDVLVAPLSDAAWTPLFLVAGAAVIDVGGQNSHAVVV